jgi:hypothetical protein
VRGFREQTFLFSRRSSPRFNDCPVCLW